MSKDELREWLEAVTSPLGWWVFLKWVGREVRSLTPWR